MTEILIPKKNIILDATLLTSIMTCGRFTDLRQNHSFVQITGKSNSLECGSIVHKALEVFYDSMSKGFKRDLAISNGMAAAELYIKGCQFCTDFIPSDELDKPKCGHPPNEYPGVKNTPPDSEGYQTGWRWVLQTLIEYFDFYKNDYWVPLETEVVKRKILFEDDEIRILWKAKLDLIADTNQGIYPIDHKTMKQRRDSLSLNNQFTGQCLVMGVNRVIINKIGFQKSLKPAEKFTRDVMSYSNDRLMEWQSEILPFWAYQLISYSEADHWPPNFTNCENKYGLCIFTKVCEAERSQREEELKKNFIVGPKWDIENLDD
jgi:hypothetical protein